MFKVKAIAPTSSSNWAAIFDTEKVYAILSVAAWALMEDPFSQKVVGLVIDPFSHKLVPVEDVRDLRGNLIQFPEYAYMSEVEEYYRESD